MSTKLTKFNPSPEIFSAIEPLKSFENRKDLRHITGIGKILAAVIFSEIGGDISKFPTVPKLVAYAGLYPKNRQSGDSINSKGHLSKRGSPYLRRAIWLAAFKDPAIKIFYERKRSEGKDHLNVMGHICHKMLSIIFAVMRDNKEYVPAQISS